MRGGGRARLRASLSLVVLVLTGCTSSSTPTPGRSEQPTLAGMPTERPQPTPTQASTPAPVATVLAFPTASEMELVPGRYDSAPPFDVEFTFEISEPGWNTAHLHGEFFDIMRFEGPDPRIPTRWLAWAHPAIVHGDRDEPAANLTPEQAAALISTQVGIEAGPGDPFTFAGLEGVQLDLHTDLAQVPLFGGPAGDFALESSQDLRLGIVKLNGEMLLVLCLGAPPELDEACNDVQPILDSVEL